MNVQQYLEATLFTELPNEPYDIKMMHCCLGMAGENGEMIDLLKKTLRYGKPLDKQKLVTEAGDFFYYYIRLLRDNGITLENVLEQNVRKLQARYPNGYSNEAAIARADTKEYSNV